MIDNESTRFLSTDFNRIRTDHPDAERQFSEFSRKLLDSLVNADKKYPADLYQTLRLNIGGHDITITAAPFIQKGYKPSFKLRADLSNNNSGEILEKDRDMLRRFRPSRIESASAQPTLTSEQALEIANTLVKEFEKTHPRWTEAN